MIKNKFFQKCPPDVTGASVEFERCLYALVVILYPFAPNIASEFFGALRSVTPLAEQFANVEVRNLGLTLFLLSE